MILPSLTIKTFLNNWIFLTGVTQIRFDDTVSGAQSFWWQLTPTDEYVWMSGVIEKSIAIQAEQVAIRNTGAKMGSPVCEAFQQPQLQWI